MLRYLGCLIIIISSAFTGRYISRNVAGRIEALKYNLEKMRKCASDYQVFGINMNFDLQESEYFVSADREFLNQVNGISNIEQLNDFISDMEKYYLTVKEKNEGIRKNSVIICILTGIAIVTLIY